MGERANVVVVEPNEPDRRVYLYTHWGGESLPAVLQAALKRGKNRWHDNAYLARIVFREMERTVDDDSTEGLGISAVLNDNEHPLLVVDVKRAMVGLALPGREPETYRSWSFTEFCDLRLTSAEDP